MKWSLCFLLFGVAFGGTIRYEEFQWGYSCENGPRVWRQHFEDCAGFTQSPISLPSAPAPTPPFLDRIEYQNADSSKKLFELNQENKAINLIYKGPENERLSLTGSVFDESKKFLFDRTVIRVGETDCCGSEHLINGTQFAAECQNYFYESKYKSFDEAMKVPGAIVVTSTIHEATDENLPTNEFFEKLPFISGTNKGIECNIENYAAQLPVFAGEGKKKRCTNCDFYFYEGSLSYPPCSQVALWHVYMDTRPFSKKQLAALRSVIDYEDKKPLVGNVRTAQPINFRDILQYRDGEEHKLPPPPQFPPQMPPGAQFPPHMMPPHGQVPDEYLRQMQQQPPAQHQHLPPYPGPGRPQQQPRRG